MSCTSFSVPATLPTPARPAPICGGTEKGSKRAEIKDLIRTLKQRNPDVEAHIFRSVENVNLDTVIGWKTGGKKYSFLDRYEET